MLQQLAQSYSTASYTNNVQVMKIQSSTENTFFTCEKWAFLFGLPDYEDEGTKMGKNIGKHLPNDSITSQKT